MGGPPLSSWHRMWLQWLNPTLAKKITVRGVVEGRDFTDPDDAVLILEHGIFCHFGKFARMAQAYADGETGWVDGFPCSMRARKDCDSARFGKGPHGAFCTSETDTLRITFLFGHPGALNLPKKRFSFRFSSAWHGCSSPGSAPAMLARKGG